MATEVADRLVGVVDALAAELKDAEDRVIKARALLEAAQRYLGQPVAMVKKDYRITTPTNGKRPIVREGVLVVMREHPDRKWLTSDLAKELGARGWLLGKNGKPSKESLRQNLHDLGKEGLVIADKQGDTKWSPVLWKLR